MTVWSNDQITHGRTIGIVPTMGFFHEGHLSLMRLAKARSDVVVVSLFVNPIQFGPGEDLDRYPRDFERDITLATGEGVDVVFAPETAAMYPEPILTTVHVGNLTDTLCGKSRPGHFDGVATVVAKIFNIVKPHLAVFGEKDFQQLAVIKRLVNDLNWDIEIIAHPIVRESDGLAMSSRNSYLSVDERNTALCLSKAIRYARSRVREGFRDADVLIEEIGRLLREHAGVTVEYVQVVDGQSLHDQQVIDNGSVLAIAVRLGRTRLIDNTILLQGD